LQGKILSRNFDEWIAHLAPLEIPVLQSTLQAIGALRSDPDVSAAKIAAAVLPDPMMTLKLMRLANANRTGSFAQRIATTEHAVMMLGLNPTFTRMEESHVLENLPQQGQHGLLRCAARAYHAASQAREWAVRRLDTSTEEVYIATLLQGLGEMAMWVAAPEQMVALEKSCREQDREQAERAVFGFLLADVSNALAEQWNMPPLVIAALQPETVEAHARPRCVMLADRLSRLAEWGWYSPQLLANLEDIAATRHTPLDEVIAQVHRSAAEVARRRSFAGVQPAATWLPMLPGEWPDENKPVKPVTTPVADPFQAIMGELANHLDNSLTLHDLLVLVVRGMRDGVGLERVVFALLTHDRNWLGAKYVVGAEDASPLKAFRFDMRGKHLLSVLMAQSQAVWMTQENRVKYAAYLNEDIIGTTSGHEFFAMSLKVHGKIIGLFYGDRNGSVMNAGSYEKFKKLCGQAAICMEHLAQRKPEKP
jgi:HD-like signal output (HDOD) protein